MPVVEGRVQQVKLLPLIHRELGSIDLPAATRQLQILARDFQTGDPIPLQEGALVYWVDGKVVLILPKHRAEFELSDSWSLPTEDQWARFLHDEIFMGLRKFRINLQPSEPSLLPKRRHKKKHLKGRGKRSHCDRRHRRRDKRAVRQAAYMR